MAQGLAYPGPIRALLPSPFRSYALKRHWGKPGMQKLPASLLLEWGVAKSPHSKELVGWVPGLRQQGGGQTRGASGPSPSPVGKDAGVN